MFDLKFKYYSTISYGCIVKNQSNQFFLINIIFIIIPILYIYIYIYIYIYNLRNFC